MVSKQFVFASWFVLACAVGGCAGNTNSSCPMPCASSQICCDGECVFNLTDRNNCGACGNPCTGSCSNGVCSAVPDGGEPPSGCSPTCASDERCCGTTCVEREQPLNVDGRPASGEDPRSPFNHCNGCGLRCDPMTAISCSTRGTSIGCACGEFGPCFPGEVCANDGGQWQCINTSTNTMHCGEVGNACAPGETCTAGVCGCGGGAPCGSGEACCGGGTCIDVSNDAANCGGCGITCTPNAPNCVAGSCTCAESGRACAAPTAGGGGFPPTPGSPGESCCPGRGCVANTATDCGCMACPSGESCEVGGSGIFGMGGGSEIATVCCGDPFQVALLGCGGFPFPGGDGGLPFPGADSGFPSFDGGVPTP